MSKTGEGVGVLLFIIVVASMSSFATMMLSNDDIITSSQEIAKIEQLCNNNGGSERVLVLDTDNRGNKVNEFAVWCEDGVKFFGELNKPNAKYHKVMTMETEE